MQNTDVFADFNFYTVPDLSPEERKPPEFIVSEMIPVGMSFLSGAPKTRKSFLAVQLAIAVATGTQFFGYKTTQCDVVYLDLEGSKNRISTRTANMSTAIPRNVFITNRIEEKLSDGLVDRLQMLHQQRPNIRLVLIDTYARAKGKNRTFGANAYEADVDFLEPIQQMALEEKIAVAFVHHDKKGAGFVVDSFERLSGTMGISGSADSVLNLITEGKRFDGKATLEFTPRDARGGEIRLEFSERFNEWQSYSEPAIDLSSNSLCKWILDNQPDPKREAFFVPYEDLLYNATRIYSSNSGEQVRKQIEPFLDELYMTYHIGVQLGVKSNGKRGLRLINLS